MKGVFKMNYKDTLTFLGPAEAILPTYDQQGNNTCRIISSIGTSTTLPMSTSKLIRSWFQSLHIDLYAQRTWSREILGQRNLNPIFFHKYHILIPIKLRKSIGAKDGCYGYIRLSSIENITSNYILLSSGTKISYLSSMKTIRIKMQHAKLLGYTYTEELNLYPMIYNKIIKKGEA